MSSTRDFRELTALEAELRQLARGLGADPATADDLVQDFYVAALEPGRPWSGGRAWLRGVLRNLYFNRLRDERRRRERELRVARPQAYALEGVPVYEGSTTLKALEDLREPYRSTLLARYFEGLSPADLARRSGIPIRTVHTRTTRALALLREEIERHRRRRALAVVWLACLGFRDRWVPRGSRLAAGIAACCAALVVLLVERDPHEAPRERAERSSFFAVGEAPVAEVQPVDDPEPGRMERQASASTVHETSGEPEFPRAHSLALRLHSQQDGKPLVGASVLLQQLEPALGIVGQGPSVVTDDQGVARFGHPPVGLSFVHVDRVGFVRYVDVPGEGVIEVDVLVPPGIQVSGRALDSAGRPVEGASILVYGEVLEPVPSATSDAQGRFELADIAPEVAILALGPGNKSASAIQTIRGRPGDRAEVEMRLDQSLRRVAGRVVSAQGRPVPRAIVAAHHPAWILGDSGAGLARVWSTRTGSSGDFELFLPAGAAEIMASPGIQDGNAPSRVLELAAEWDQEIDLHLRGSAEIEGTVLLDGDIRPRPRVVCEPTGDAGANVLSRLFGARSAELVSGGRFRLIGLAPGNYRVQLRAAEFEAGAVLELGDGERVRWDPSVRRLAVGAKVRGRLVDPAGLARAEMILTLRNADDDNPWERHAKTNARGFFEFPPVHPGDWHLAGQAGSGVDLDVRGVRSGEERDLGELVVE